MEKLIIREPLQHLLVELGACDAAITWAKGKQLDQASWDAAEQEWQNWLADRLGCKPEFAAIEKATKSRYGDGDGYGDGDSYGDGDGYGGMS